MKIPTSALVVGAHPDDCEFGAGGTVYRWAREGCRVHFLIVTDGSRGSGDRDLGEVDLVQLRRREQEEAAAVLAVESCRFLGFRDGDVDNNRVLLRELVKVVRELKPEVVFTHTPEPLEHRRFSGGQGAFANHRDHRAVGQATLDAVYPFARNPNSFQELTPECHKAGTVYLWGSRHTNVEFHCPEGLKKKAEALACHRSQFAEETDWDGLVRGWGESEKFESVVLT